MKRFALALFLACAACIGLLSGCVSGQQSTSTSTSASGQSASAATSTGKVKVVCATFPAYDWARQVAGNNAGALEITYLMDSGTDLHSYQPTVEDIASISSANLFVYVGGESDEWASDAVRAAGPNLKTVNMLEAIGSAAVEEEVVEGMQADHHEAKESEHAEEDSHDHDSGESPEYDEHVWLSLRNAQVLVNAIADALSAADPGNSGAYAENAKAYKAKLAALDERYAAAVKAAAKDTLVFADRFPFRYLVDDYNLKYYAAFVGCSAETEASFETVAFLAKKVDELGVNDILTIEGSDQKIAKTVIDNTQAKNQEIAVMDSLQSAATADITAGKTYLSTMEENLSVLEEALS